MQVGRPPKYKTPEEMQKVIDEYFETDAYADIGNGLQYCPTVEGLAHALGMSRRALLGYEDKKEFLPTIKAAKQRVAIALEQRLYGSAVTGAIFNLKNNFGWKDQQDHNVTTRDATGLSDEELEAIAAGRS